jgi:ABC-type lipoprotein release transport system permease subunit
MSHSLVFALAWRNLWRNTRRSVITMTALTFGVAGITLLHSYRDSIYGLLVQDVTEGLVGHLQVHAQGYQSAPAIGTLVKNPVHIEAVVAEALPGAVAERRVIGAGLAGAGDESAPVMILGLRPKRGSGKALHTVVEGRDLSESAKREVIVGRELARDLHVAPGAEVVLVSQAADGSVANDRFSVVGLFTSSSAEFDATAVALHLTDAQDFFALGDGVHQLVVRLPRAGDDLTTPLLALRQALDLSTLEALSWSEILPELDETMRTKRRAQHLIDVIVFLIVGLGVFNAMTMSTFERTREFGVMASLGTRPGRIVSLVVTEALLQGALAFTAGIALSSAVLYGLGTIDMSNLLQGDMMGARIPSIVTLGLKPEAVASAAIVAFSTVVLGGLIPALRAAALDPVEAMRHT